MILVTGATLKQQSPSRIDDGDRNGAMQQALTVRRQFRGATDLAVLRIDQDQLFGLFVHRPGAPRKIRNPAREGPPTSPSSSAGWSRQPERRATDHLSSGEFLFIFMALYRF